MHYPKWIFHKTEAPKVVNTKEEHDQAGKGWEETPAAFDKKPDAKVKKQEAGKDETEVGATSENPDPSGEASLAPAVETEAPKKSVKKKAPKKVKTEEV